MSAAAWVASSTEVAWMPVGTGTSWRANSCLPWYSSRSMSGARTLAKAVFHNARADAAAEEDRMGDVRRLRDPHRLGGGDHQRLLPGSRPRRVHDRARPADPALHGDREGHRGRLVRALRRGPAPHCGADLQGAGVAARALPLGVPARFRPALAAVSGDQ